MSSYKIVAFLKDNNGKKYKIEKVFTNNLFESNKYHVLYENGDIMFRNFQSKEEAIRYLESQVGAVRSY